MGMATRSSDEESGYRVIKNGDVLSVHRHYGQAETEAKSVGADRVYYMNSRGFGVTVWPLPPLA